MPLVAKRFRHVAVAIPEVRVSLGIAVSRRQQCPQPQQPDVTYHQTLIGWRGRQSLNRDLGFGHVAVGRAIKRLASAPAEEGLAIRDIWLLRLRALLARAHGDEARYRDYRDRYRDMARTLGFEGHIAWAEAMT